MRGPVAQSVSKARRCACGARNAVLALAVRVWGWDQDCERIQELERREAEHGPTVRCGAWQAVDNLLHLAGRVRRARAFDAQPLDRERRART